MMQAHEAARQDTSIFQRGMPAMVCRAPSADVLAHRFLMAIIEKVMPMPQAKASREK